MRILSLELGSWSVKAVEIESRFRKFEILDLHEVKLPLRLDDPTAIYREAVAEILAKVPSHPDKLVASLPAPKISTRFLKLPVKQRKKVEQMYRYELEDTLPFKLDDTVVEHQFYPMRDSSLVFAAIAPNRFVSSHLDYLKSIGIDSDWLTFDGMGLINLYITSQKNEPTDNEGPVLLLDIGHTKTNISVINETRLEAFRCLNWGGLAITKSIAITSGVALEEAQELKHRLNISDPPRPGTDTEILESTRQTLGSLITEINHSLIAYKNVYKQTPTSIVLTGGTALFKGLCEFLSSELGNVQTRVFSPAAAFPIKEELSKAHETIRFSEVWGMGTVFSRKSPLLFNFRKSDFAKHTSLAEIASLIKNPSFIKLSKYTVLLILILFVHVSASNFLASKENEKASEEIKKVFQDTFKNAPRALKNTLTSNPTELKKYIDQKNNEMEQKLKMVSKSRQTAVSVIKQITNSFPTNVKVDVNKLEIVDSDLLLEGVLYEGSLNLVTDNLKKLNIINNLAVNMDGQRFTYRAKVMGR